MTEQIERYGFKLSIVSELMGGHLEVVQYTGDGEPFVRAVDHDAVLAARNARIAKLEGLLREVRHWFETQKKAISKGCGSSWDVGQCLEQINHIDDALAGQPQQSEPEWPKEQCPVTGAVHDVDPADLTALEGAAAVDELKELRVQPAHQVGGDGLDEQKTVATVRVTNGGYTMKLARYVAYALPEGEHELFPRAALFPAAAVVMPERANVLSGTSEYTQLAETYNDALDQVARLNRNTVSLELLKRMINFVDRNTHYQFGEPLTSFDAEGGRLENELRAILEGGKL